MKYLGWLFLLLEFLGYAVIGHKDRPLTLPMAIADGAFILSGSALIIADRLKPKKETPNKEGEPDEQNARSSSAG